MQQYMHRIQVVGWYVVHDDKYSRCCTGDRYLRYHVKVKLLNATVSSSLYNFLIILFVR